MGRVARLRKLNLREQRQQSLEFASNNIEARKAEVRKAIREEKAQKMSDEFGITKEAALKVLAERSKAKREKKAGKGAKRHSAFENNLQSGGALEKATAEGKES